MNYYESEQAVIGALLEIGDMSLDAPTAILNIVKQASFSAIQHQTIFQNIKQMAAAGEHVDLITLDARLINQGKSELTGGFAYLVDLQKIASPSNAVAHAKIVRDSAIERKVNAELNNAMAMLQERDGRSIYEKVGEVESMISSILDRSIRNESKGLVHCMDVMDKWSEEMENRFKDPESSKGFSTGYEGLDNVIGIKLVRPKSLVVVGARPKMGKTAMLAGMVKSFGLEQKKAVALFSLEMPSDQIMERMLCERANVNGDMFYEGGHDEDFAKVSAAMGEYSNSQVYMDDTAGITINHVKSEVRKLAKKQPLGLIAIDYLTLMEAEKADRNDLAYGIITKELKKLAKELDCVVLLLTQLNRSLEQRTNKRPMPSDSRDTGQIEQDCDLWIGLYREAVYNDEIPPEQQGLTEAIVRLNRHGNTGTAYFDLKNGYFIESTMPTSTGFAKYDDDEY
tara:strand:+ start:172 stop:1533 length:1362 start_codon:yes stop_codon:yes gene_type:complete